MIPFGHGPNHNGLPPAPVVYHTHAGQTPHHGSKVMLTQGGHPETHYAPTAGGSQAGDQSQAIVKHHSGPLPQPHGSHTASPHDIHSSAQNAPNHAELTVSFPHSMKPCPI